MNYRLDKLVGRDPLPTDKVAFDRVTNLFARARQVEVKLPAKKGATATAPTSAPARKTA